LLTGALENLLEQPAQLLPGAHEVTGAGRMVHERVLEHAIAGLQLQRLFEEADESLPAVGLGRCRLGDRSKLADSTFEDRLDECLARCEVPVERADADTGSPRDFLERSLVVQNDAQPENVGVATSTATFFRSVGGSFGVAIFGAIFATRLSNELAHLPQNVVARLGSGVQLSPAAARRLPPTVHADFLQAFAHALHGVFLWGAAIAVVPFVLSWFLKELPLRDTLHRPAELSAEQAAAGDGKRKQIVESQAPANRTG